MIVEVLLAYIYVVARNHFMYLLLWYMWQHSPHPYYPTPPSYSWAPRGNARIFLAFREIFGASSQGNTPESRPHLMVGVDMVSQTIMHA